YLAVALAFALSLLAKPMLVTLPCLLLLLDYWPLERFRPGGRPTETGTAARFAPATPGRLVLEKLPLFALVAACVVLTLHAQVKTRHSLTLPAAARVGNALVSYVAYAAQAVWPRGLAVFYPHPRTGLPVAEAAGAGLLLAGVTAVVAWAGRRRPYLVVGWL